MVVDIFGKPSSVVTEYVLFHDESVCGIDKFLYHGFLLVKISEGSRILKELLEIKEKYCEPDREIHFKKIKQRSNHKYGRKTKVALKWLEKAKEWLYHDQINFYIMGINKNNLKNFWDNKKSYEFNVYTRFFEIGLKSTVRWFAEGDINRGKELSVTYLYFDPKDIYCDLSRKEKTIMVSNLLKAERKAGAIKTDKIRLLDSDSRISGLSISNFIQLTDVLCGVCRASFVVKAGLGWRPIPMKNVVKKMRHVLGRYYHKHAAKRITSSLEATRTNSFRIKRQPLVAHQVIVGAVMFDLHLHPPFRCFDFQSFTAA